MSSFPKQIERLIETAIFASRWILAPFYLGLALSLFVLLIKFLFELVHIAEMAFTATESQVILGLLALVDLSLTGSLIVIVIFSGYENFVSKIDHTGHRDWPEWMGTIDFTALKIKLLGSIVAISAIQLLKQFMSINTVSDRDLFWLVVIHVVFVASSVLLALSDRISGASHGNAEPASGAPGASPPSTAAKKHA
ncbi:TIGR00645 family protein [Hyphomicrobium sp. 1Nfss2.1]|uniref:TIGR00645 family protein n=1 Tax=Hyphomicrobium sp. 1Nfss2.1 TaxID=3413936 RepID=UPI003C79FDC3